ncbi:lipid A deacylase LpxR family protein [Roseivirga sp.]|uniref:lipid A deacylase LpxR family protein n=1 Tax=Roseivirga sp. TaxID=1964215 RepID=UPI003B8CF125
MYSKGIAFFLCLTISSGLYAQGSYKNSEFSFTNENDVYLLKDRDKYYSNGLITHFRWVPKSFRTDTIKKIVDIEFSQKYYTPQDLLLRRVQNFDRPYAGLLYGGASFSTFKEKHRHSMLGVEIGIVGPASGAQGFQEWYHETFGFPAPRGWDFQIPNELVFNFKSEFNRQYQLKPGKWDLISSTDIALGTAFTHVYQRLDIRFGKLQFLRNSAFKNALIGPGSDEIPKHNYFFMGYGLQYVAHNITINGSIWNDNAPHTESIKPLVRHFRMGWASSSESATFKVTYNWSSPEVNGNERHAYLGFELQLRFPRNSTD